MQERRIASDRRALRFATLAAVLLYLCTDSLAAEATGQITRKSQKKERTRPSRRSETISPRQRDAALKSLPDIRRFQSRKSNRFLVDLAVVRTGHPYKGLRAQKPHTGAHIYFQVPQKPLPADSPQAFPPIYAVADGVISRIDKSFKLREMYEPALKKRVSNYRYGIGLLFAKSDGHPVTMHYSIEPFVDPGSDRFYEPFLDVKVGQRVKKGDVVARMYLPANRQLARKSHIHFNLLGGRDHRFQAPAIFDQRIVRRFHATWGRFGTDGDREIPPCLGYLLDARENPFGKVPVDGL